MVETVHRGYRFFGQLVVVESDDRDVAECLDAIYSRQRASVPAIPEGIDLSVRVVTGRGEARHETHGRRSGRHGEPRSSESRGEPEGARIEVGGRTIRVADPTQIVHYAHLVLINAAASLVDDALVLHSGAVCRDGNAALLVGHSGRGKTTLTVELVSRGWQFLSDDFAVLRTDGGVQAFPRRVNLTDQSLSLLDLEAPTGSVRVAGFGNREKWLIDIDDLFPGQMVDEARLGAVFLLGRGLPVRELAAADRPTTWELELDHTPVGLVDELMQLTGVQSVSPFDMERRPRLLVEAAPGTCVVAGIDEVCADYDVTVMAARRVAGRDSSAGSRPAGAAGSGDTGEGSRRGPRPDAPQGPGRSARHGVPETARHDPDQRSGQPAFQAEPTLSQLTREEALPEMLSHALSLSGRRYLGGTSHAEVLRAVADLNAVLAIAGAPLFRLGLGPVAATADMVEATMKKIPARESHLSSSGSCTGSRQENATRSAG